MAVQDYKINYKSDFVLNINGDAGWAIPFCIKFWTGMPSQAYFVGFDGVKYVNCRVGDTPTQLLVMFDDHHLPIGPLRMQIAYHTTIEEFPGSVFDEVTNARDVIVTIDGTDYQVLLDFTGEDAPELEFDLPAYANEAERIQNELQRQQNEAARIAAELQREQATAAAVQGAENVNAQLNGTTLTVTNRQGVSTSVNTKGERGEQGPVGPEGPQGEQGVSIVSFRQVYASETATYYSITFSDGHEQSVAIPKGAKGDTGATGPTGPQGPQGQTGVSITGLVKTGETETDTLYNVTFSNGTTQAVAIPKGEKGDQGPVGPQGPQGPMGDVAVITPEQQAAFTMYSTTGQNTDGPMTQKAVTDVLVAGSISYNNSQSGLAADNVQGALDEVSDELYTQSNYPFELGSISTDNGQEVTKTNGSRIRTKGKVPKSTNKINFTVTRSCVRANIILYNNEVFAGSVSSVYVNLTAGTYVYEVNVEYAWDSYRIVCFTSGYTSQNLDGNYSVGYSSIKDNVLQLDEDVANINNVLPHGDTGSVSLELSESDYTYGNIRGTDGSIQPNDKAIYLVDALDVRNASSLSYSLDNSYRLGIAVYDKNGFVKKDEWFTGSGTYQLGGAMSIRIVIACPAGGSTFDYESANPHFSLYLNGLKEAASLDDVDDLYEHYDDVIYKGEYSRFELGAIDGSNGENMTMTDGTRIRTKGYVNKGDGIVRVTFAIPITRMNIIFFKDNEYVGWIDGAYDTAHSAGYYEYKINTQYEYDTYRINCRTSDATSETANNTYVYNPALAEYIYNIQDSQENINIEALNTAKIYEYYDALAEKFPNYISKRVLGMDTSGQHEIREYVATLRDNYAYLYKERCYAWKNGSTTIFTESISPRIGDATYSDQLTTSTGYTVSASNCNNLTITVNGTTYSRQESEDIAADIQYRSTGTSSSITVSGKTYNRLPDYDKSSTCKKTIVSICNEHGPGINGDPREPSVVMFYLLQALCGETSENPQLDWLKRYAKLVIIPVSNPYAYDEEGDSTTLGNMMGRVNPNGVNINRNYPTTDWVTLANNEAGAYGGSEVETQYNINCIMRHNADIAIDEHCLGPNPNNYNQWHYEGLLNNSISSEKKMLMLSTYNLAYTPYTASLPGHGSTWIEQHDIDGCLIEMNQGYANTLHSGIILRADRQIWMGVLEYYGIFLL